MDTIENNVDTKTFGNYQRLVKARTQFGTESNLFAKKNEQKKLDITT